MKARKFGFYGVMTMTKKDKRNLLKVLAFISPWIVGFLVFTVYPVVVSFYYSFCDYSVFEKPVWTGLDNYMELFTDGVFWQSLWNTFYYSLLALPLGIIVAFLISLLLNTKSRGMTFFRTFFYIPTLVPLVALAILWMWILNGQFGLINYFLSLLGIRGPNWLNDKYLVIPALVFMGLWTTGRTMVVLLASLQDVPVTLYEAADIDGASFFQKTLKITLPMISSIIFFNIIMGIIGSLQIFAEPYIMTGGGPGRASTFYSLYLYQKAFEDYQMGYASAMAWILFIIILLLTVYANRISKKFVYYRGVK